MVRLSGAIKRRTEIEMELTLDIVKAARELITDRAHWGKGSYAGETKFERDDGIRSGVAVSSPAANCFCGLGAIRRAAAQAMIGTDQAENEFVIEVVGCVPEKYRAAYADKPYASFATFNDAPETKHADVLGAFDCLIAKMEAAK